MSDSPIREVVPGEAPEIQDAPEPELDPDSDHELAPIPDEPLFEPEQMEDFNPETPWLHRPWMFNQMRILGKTKEALAEELNVHVNVIQTQVRLFDLN
jgi:hypothetical protein